GGQQRIRAGVRPRRAKGPRRRDRGGRRHGLLPRARGERLHYWAGHQRERRLRDALSARGAKCCRRVRLFGASALRPPLPLPAFGQRTSGDDMIRYARLGYVALNVTDLDRSCAFYREVVGLQEVPSTNPALRLLRCSEQHQDIVLYRGEPGLKRAAFELESAAVLDPLRRTLREAGHEF